MPLSGTLYVEANNPECDKAALLCHHLVDKGVLSCTVTDITSEVEVRSAIRERTGSVRLPILDLVNIAIFHYGAMLTYFSRELRDLNL